MAHFNSNIGVSRFTIFLITLLIGYTSCEYDQLFNNGKELCVGTNCPERSGNGIAGGMWFGPRLGRRRRSGEILMDNENEIDNMLDISNDETWNFLPYHGIDKKRHSTQFTPRLGRELVDEFLQKVIAMNNNNHLAHMFDTKLSDVDSPRQLMQPPSLPLLQPRFGRQQIHIPSARLHH